MKVTIRRASEDSTCARNLDDVPLEKAARVLDWVRAIGLAGEDASYPLMGEIVLPHSNPMSLGAPSAFYDVIICDTSQSRVDAQNSTLSASRMPAPVTMR